MGSRDGIVVRALASQQCVPVSISILFPLLAPGGVYPGTPVFPSPQKPLFPNSNSILECTDTSERVLVNSILGALSLNKLFTLLTLHHQNVYRVSCAKCSLFLFLDGFVFFSQLHSSSSSLTKYTVIFFLLHLLSFLSLVCLQGLQLVLLLTSLCFKLAQLLRTMGCKHLKLWYLLTMATYTHLLNKCSYDSSHSSRHSI